MNNGFITRAQRTLKRKYTVCQQARLSFLKKNLENAVPFITGSCREFKPDVLGEWEAPLGSTPLVFSY